VEDAEPTLESAKKVLQEASLELETLSFSKDTVGRSLSRDLAKEQWGSKPSKIISVLPILFLGVLPTNNQGVPLLSGDINGDTAIQTE
jgi:hypothetical protein